MPTTSDRFIDVLRVFAIVAIVGQHWLIPELTYENGILTATSSLAAPGRWSIAWVGQVLPLFFFAGGAAAAISLRARERRLDDPQPTTTWLIDGARRMAVPVLPLAAIWLTLPRLLVAVGVPTQPVQLASELVGQLIWFLAVYAMLVSLTPILLRLHDRWRGREAIALAAAAVGVDVVRFTVLDGSGWISYANVVLVWGAIYQAGITYAEGGPIRRRTAATLGAAGLAATALAVAVGLYAPSAIGVPGQPLSNITAPAAALLALAAGQLGLALVLRDALIRWADHGPVTATLDWVSARLTTVLVWHIPALVVVAGVTVVGIGYTNAEPFSTGWRADAPMWLAALAVVLTGFVRAFGRFERQQPRTVRVTAPSAAEVGLPSTRSHRAAGLVRRTLTGRLEA
jgi:hypothetical protein